MFNLIFFVIGLYCGYHLSQYGLDLKYIFAPIRDAIVAVWGIVSKLWTKE